MILADKIIRLRKKNGWSQEELADKMNVSRQAVSKWEAAQTTPDLQKILQLGELFGVTTDYLLKDELEAEEFTGDSAGSQRRSVTLEDANAYLAHRSRAADRIALATVLCILSPVTLLLLGVLAEQPGGLLTENAAGLTGLIVLFLLVAAAVAVYLSVDAGNSPYKYLEADDYELAYGVSGMVRERQKQFRSSYIRGNILGTCLCILAPVILLIGAFTEQEVTLVLALSAMMAVVAAGVWQFIAVGVRWAAMERLLREGDFSQKGKKRSRITEAVGTVYWMLATAVYLGWSFWTEAWQTTWMVWPVAGVLFVAVMVLTGMLLDRDGD